MAGRAMVLRVRLTKQSTAPLENVRVVMRSSAFPGPVQLFSAALEHETVELTKEVFLGESVAATDYVIKVSSLLRCQGETMSAEGVCSQDLQVAESGGQITVAGKGGVIEIDPDYAEDVAVVGHGATIKIGPTDGQSARTWLPVNLSWRKIIADETPVWPAEWPHHLGEWVKLGQRLIMRAPVSQQLWEAVHGRSWYDYMHRADELFWIQHNKVLAEKDMPVFGVTLAEAMDFCELLNGYVAERFSLADKWRFHLPTEEMWLAARGDTLSRGKPGDYGFCKGFAGYGSWPSRPLTMKKLRDSFPLNAQGLAGMIGNLWDWCVDPAKPGEGIWRGGSWSELDVQRDRFIPDASQRSTRCGFRIVASPC